ncbi:hypothetical protein EW146_g5467 [Bondarzewia mesenterica]|uniref:Calcium-channel protein CCH1 n=1 Tax=Bondarzewia mesenterica TaxID=1095465 RepID=A0A4S4LRE8_9AGAM|nr:hypothetical protein EW146_g5467 [Bondarzewia mesenterica]
MDHPLDHHPSGSISSSSSAVDLPGLASAGPSSPSLGPSETHGSFARRRTSWGMVEDGQDPLRHLDGPFRTSPALPQSSNSGTYVLDDDPFAAYPTDDPFAAPAPERYPTGRAQTYEVQEDRYGSRSEQAYANARAAASAASLIDPASSSYYYRDSRASEGDTGRRDDDEAHLTSNMARADTPEGWSADSERADAAVGRRRTLRYSVGPSPLRKTGSRFRSVSRSIKRASLRVVNLAGMGLEEHARLDDVEDEDKGKVSKAGVVVEEEMDEDEEKLEGLPDLRMNLPIRGRTLGCLGPENSVRLAMYRFLVYPWTEPAILCLIIFNAVILTIQASHSLTLSDPNAAPPPVKGYFHAWEDYALFVLFVFFRTFMRYSLEAFARICVTGFILDPDVPISTLFTSPFATPDAMLDAVPSTLTRQGSLTQTQVHPTQLTRSHTITHRLRQFYSNVSRPFALMHSGDTFPTGTGTTPGIIAPSISTSTASSSSSSSSRFIRLRSDTAGSTTPIMEKAMQQARSASKPAYAPPSALARSATELALPFKFSVALARGVTERNVPYLRHSWSRVDFVAIIGFWVTVVLAETGVERGSKHVGLFRALSVLRISRLLAVTSGTTTIMRSLKIARPLLASVLYFVLFAMALFSIIGIQTFSGSFRRSCYLSPTLGVEDEIQLGQQCGGYIDPQSLNATGYIPLNGDPDRPKGYICPLGQVCKEDQNPNSGIESFDTIYFSALQVVIVSSANGWSPIMYSMIDSEFFVSCIFFIVCIVVLNFWLINLFVAVITNTFSAIREETQKSAFGAAPLRPVMDDNAWALVDGRNAKQNRVREMYEHIRWCWVALALASLVLQATRTVDMSPTHEAILDNGELVLTIAFDIEIAVRVLAHLPDWRAFFRKGNNLLDLVLAIVSTVIQIPVIHNSAVYRWLTIFQLMRFYRVILEIPRMKPLLMSVFGNMYGLANMTLFLLLVNFIAALVAVQILRGDMIESDTMNFGQIFTSFLAVYQVFSSENWTNVLYDSSTAEVTLGQSAITVLFISAWFFFANFIVLQMFIAVINENFNVAEESKRGQQANHYWAAQQPQQTKETWRRRFNPYRWFKASPKAIVVENLPSNLVLPMQKSLVQDYGLPSQDRRTNVRVWLTDTAFGLTLQRRAPENRKRGVRHYTSKSLNMLQQLFIGDTHPNDVPLANLRNGRRESLKTQDPNDEEMERHLELLAMINNEAVAAEDASDAFYERRAQKADFIRDHPSYDKTFWIFSQKNKFRRLCQALVRPPNGERIFGRSPAPILHTIFQLLLLLTVVGGIVTEAIATPIYRRNFYLQNGFVRGSWFDINEAVFGLLLVVEFIIKIIADGFAFTPNAYVRSIWNILDFFIMIGLLVNVTTGLIFVGGLSRFTRALKALRALRLITLVEKMRTTFESLIISGVSRILDAALLAILYMIPYAVWGLNIFAGETNTCNDNSVQGTSDCINEYTNTVIGSSAEFPFPVPRVWDNPSPSTTFSFDSFRSSLLILFEIVSLEGWTDVMGVATSITGFGQQPQTNASQVNAIFFLVYNLLGAVVILTLFVSSPYIDLVQHYHREFQFEDRDSISDPAATRTRPRWPIRAWCFDQAVRKHGWWSRMMTVLFTVHIFALMQVDIVLTFQPQHFADQLRSDFFVFITSVYVLDILVRLYGLGWHSFRANGWNLFDIVVAGGSLITTVSVRVGANGYIIEQLQKLFLVSIAFKLIQRMNNLNKLFKTAISSLPVILSLLSLWVTFFLFFGILFVEVFSLTKWESGETQNQNYTTLGTALVMLAFMTSGEGWNQYMHDYALVYPRCTNSSATDPDSDCGSVGWAFTLFIAWNLLSMYIFVNMFTGVVVENFSYVFQMTGGSKAVTREEMRAFKKVWAEFANPRTGFLERNRFVPFFAKLSGIFEVRIYPVEYNVPEILATCKATGDTDTSWNRSTIIEGVDLDKLNRNLSRIDYSAIRKRRNLYSRLYHEASISHQHGKGISFTDMLLLLSHHKLIVDKDALILKDLVVRTETNKLVTDLVNVDRVRSYLKCITYRRRFLAQRDSARREKEAREIPAIIVDDFPSTPPQSTRDIASHRLPPSPFSDSESPSHSAGEGPRDPFDLSISGGSPRSSTLQRARRTSDVSMLSTDLGLRYMRDLSPSRDPSLLRDDEGHDVLTSMQNSSWGDLMLEVEEEEHRD